MKACKMPKQDGRQGVASRGGKVQGGKEHGHYKCFNIQINMSQKKEQEIIQELEHFPKLSEKHIYKGPLTAK